MLGSLVVIGMMMMAVGLLAMNRLRKLWRLNAPQQPWLVPPPEDQPGWTEYARNLKPPSETS